jgi:hypothetical protein
LEFSKLEYEVAGCLRRLFRQRHLLRSRNLQWFQKVVDHKLQLQKVLNNFFLNLVIDESLGVIYLTEITDEIEERLSFSMGRKKTLDPYASLLVIQLRHDRFQFYLNPEETDFPMVTQESLREYLKTFNTHSIDARFERSFQAAIKALKELHVLIETGADTKVYEISAICDLLLPLDEIQQFQAKINNYFGKEVAVDDGEASLREERA